METYFNALAAHLDGKVAAPQRYLLRLAAESSDFVRFNHGLIRQAGHVQQRVASLQLIEGLRHASATVTLGGAPEDDIALLDATLRALRRQLHDLPEDPHLLLPEQAQSSRHSPESHLPPAPAMVEAILALARGHDMVGILASGPLYRGLASSEGQRNWHQSDSFNFDFSLFQGGAAGDKAVKSVYAGQRWDGQSLRATFDAALLRLALLARPAKRIAPGAYRAFLAPTALNEIIGMLNWDGVSEKSLRTRQSSLRRMRDEDVRLSPLINLSENTAAGIAPGFQEDGFVKPPTVTLIENGRLVGSMVSPRSQRQYGVPANGAGGNEGMSAIDLAAGELAGDDILATLGTGLLIGNLWYLNYSDRASCRMTGMTRFATFWVDDGEIVAPIDVMRFDESLYRLLGENLLGLTRERELLIDNSSYGARGSDSARLPGALVKDFNFVL
jgi:predicted Zn-dependent protease